MTTDMATQTEYQYLDRPPLRLTHDFSREIKKTCVKMSFRSSQVNFISDIRIYIHKKVQSSKTEINIEIKITTTAIEILTLI